jgi:trans-aconitate methyltransferase
MKVVDKVLEIGIYQGESLDMLSHFFNDAIIHGIDISDCSNLNSEKIKTHQHNQEIIGDLNEFIENVGGNFDLIIDDGGHTMKQQQLSFGVLFKHLKKGGVYIIEDLHTSLWSSHISSDDVITTLEMLNQLNETGKLLSNHISDKDKKYIEESIDSIKIWSRTPDYNESVTSIIIKK